MKSVVKQVLRNYFKNPIFWMGILIVVAFIYQQLHPYLEVHRITSKQEASKFKEVSLGDTDIINGYVPSSPAQQREIWEEHIVESLISDFAMTDVEAEAVIHFMEDMEIKKACEYLKKEYKYNGAIYFYEDAAYHRGTMEEVNSYIDKKLDEHSFSFYFSRKFADFAGLFMAFFALVVLAVLFIQDTRKSTYELLHTKPIRAGGYIFGKVIGGFSTCCIVLGLLNIIFYVLCRVCTKGDGFEVYPRDFLFATMFYILPNMLMIVCVYTLIALLFKNPLPAAPLLFLYIVYSNMGSRNAEGNFGYYGRPLAIMVRFPGRFFDTAPPPMIYLNQLFLILASTIIIFISVQLWKRRRI